MIDMVNWGVTEKKHQWSKGDGTEKPARFVNDNGRETWRCWRPNCPGLLATVAIEEKEILHKNIATDVRTKIKERDVFLRLDGFKLILKDKRKFWEKRNDGKSQRIKPAQSSPEVVACPCCNELSFIATMREIA